MTTEDTGRLASPLTEGLGPLPEPDYYAAADSDIRPRLIHRRAEVELHLRQLEKDGGRHVPWEGNVWGLYVESNVRRVVVAAVAAERERCATLCEEWAKVRTPEHGGLALRNVAERIRRA